MRVAVASWLGSTNLGDELIFAALHRKLAARGAQVAGISVDPAGTRTAHGVGAVRPTDPGRLWGLLGSADRLVFGGGGLLQDETSALNLPYHLSRLALARARGVPAAAVGVGAGVLSTAAGRLQVRTALRGLTGVSVRDAESADLLEGLGLPRPTLAADLALSLPVPTVEPADRMVVSLRPWAGTRTAVPVVLRWESGLDNSWFAESMAAALDTTARSTGLPTHFVAFQRDRDDRLHQMVADRMTTPTSLSCPSLATVVDEVAASRVVVGMRYHAGIAAVLAGRPSVLISYSDKVSSLARDVGHGAVGLTWQPEDVAQIPKAVHEVLDAEADVVEARGRLRERERGNDEVLDRLLAP
jgi:polysaccharide pyruvyl transferase CsaB